MKSISSFEVPSLTAFRHKVSDYFVSSSKNPQLFFHKPSWTFQAAEPSGEKSHKHHISLISSIKKSQTVGLFSNEFNL